mgnify:CR=1 FL=1
MRLRLKVEVDSGKLFALINSGIEPLPYMYKGDLFRIHTKHTVIASTIDPNRERIIGKVWSDGSCSTLSYPEYNGMLVAFSKTFDFTAPQFHKVCPSDTANIFHQRGRCNIRNNSKDANAN